MTIIYLINNLFRNFFTFFKTILFVNSVDWGANIRRKSNCIIDPSTKIYGCHTLNEVVVGFGTYISNNSKISYTEIGKFCSIGPNFTCGFGIHPINGISTSPIFYSTAKQCGFTLSKTNKIIERKKIKIGNDVFIGANVTVLDGVTIGDGAIIGAGAVVNKDIPPYGIAVGCPIRVIKFRFDSEVIKRLLLSEWWNMGQLVFEKVEANFFNVEHFLDSIEPKGESSNKIKS